MSLIKTRTRRILSSIVAGLMLTWQLATPLGVSATQQATVTICHRTDSYTNPYVEETVAQSAVDGDNGNDNGQGDHYQEHQGPIFSPSIPKHTEWGDIIPAINHVHSGLNWTSEGQDLLRNHCNPDRGGLTVNKQVDANGDGTYEGGNDAANGLGFTWSLEGDAQTHAMGETVSDVITGTQNVTENSTPGYEFTGWYITGDTNRSCDNPEGTTLPISVKIKKDKTKSITLCNQACPKPKKGEITIIKDAQPNSNDAFDFESQKLGNFTLDDNGNNNDNYSNAVTFSNLDLKTYVVHEKSLSGWRLSDVICNDEDDITFDKDSATVSIELDEEEPIVCTFVNTKQTKLTIKKEISPASSQDFNFESGQLGNFTLDVDNNPTFSDTKVFSDLNAGDYTVSEQELDEWHLSGLSCNGTEDYNVDWSRAKLQVHLNAGDDVTCTFVNKKENAINGFKFEDLNGNGKWDEGEPTLEGWTINLIRACDDEQEDCEADVVKTIQTNEDGFYTFNEIDPGNYLVCEEQQNGWVQTFPWWHENGCHEVTIEGPGQVVPCIDFGNFHLGEVKGAKFNDVNGNGKWDEGEPTLKNWTISLYQQSDQDDLIAWLGTPTKTTKTDANGVYSFDDLEPGNYKVCETQQVNWTQTFPTTNNGCHEFTVETSGQIVTADFGNKAKPQVLGESTAVTPAALVNTGADVSKNLMIGLTVLSVLGAMHFLTSRRKDYAQ